MRPHKRKIIAIHEETGERREFESASAFAQEFGMSQGTISNVMNVGGTAKGWRLYDTPNNIRKRIAELEAQIEMLEG